MESQDTHQTAQQMNLSILNPLPQTLPGPALLHDLIQTTSPSNAPAIAYYQSTGIGPQETVSYSELHSRSEHLARRILAVLPQVQDQLVVPLLLPQCPALYISQLAVLKAGGAFCPLNLDAPPERVRFIFGDVSARVIITSQYLRSHIDSLGMDVVVIVVDEDEAEPPNHLPLPSPSPNSLAYIMYTSGSTGTPKGVGITHAAVTQSLLAHNRHIPTFSRFLQFAAPTFDVSVFEIFFPLFRGATLLSVHRPALLNDLPAVLRHTEADACELTPTVAGSLLRKRENAPGLKLVLTIGEMLTENVIREFGGDTSTESVLWAMYGPTEATIHCTLQPACLASSSSHNIGFTLDTVSAFILEPLADDGTGEFKVLPLGEMGELAVGGQQNAVGYLNRPEQTAQAFIETPYGRLYRTGDKARMNPDDKMIECYGRISDGQVKLRGQRIELGEIEQAMLRTPGCCGAVATVIGGVVVAFCEGDEGNVLQTCQEWLPTFMVPGDFVLMETFPRLASGKVDRKKLKADYEANRGEEVGEFTDEVEQQLAIFAKEALGVHLTPSSILAVAGVDSLGAIKFASRLRQAGFDVNAVDVLGSRTLASLHARIRKSTYAPPIDLKCDTEKIQKAAASLGTQPEAIEAVVSCTPMQTAMLAETLRNPEAYCNWIQLQVPSVHTVEIIASWFQELARCNEILRTGFAVLDGSNFSQIIWQQLQPSQTTFVKHLTRRYQLDEQDFIHPFSVQISKSRKHTDILLQIHHALYDGWSFDLLLSDLNTLATGGIITPRPFFRLVANYYASSDFLAVSNAAQAYWAEYLLNYQPTPMPQLLAKTFQNSQIFSAQRNLNILPSTVQQITTKLSISPQVLFQSAFLYLWSVILGNPDDTVIGNVTAGRILPITGVEDIVGPCLTSIPLRARLSQVRTIRELLESIHASNRESLPHSTLPLGDIKKAAGIASGQAVYDALFVYQESIPSRSRQQQQTVRQIAHEDYLETKLLVEVEPIAGKFQLRVTYHADIFHYGYMQLFLRQFEAILDHINGNVDAEVETIAGCFADNLLSTYNLTPKTLKTTPDLATLFESIVEEQPDSAALCFANSIDDEQADLRTVSYADLNKMANRIAHQLLSSGAEETHPVAIIMEKSVMLYAGILGVLKAGCAYLPLLPSTPKARIETILIQADVQICLSDADDFTRLHEYPDANPYRLPNSFRIANIVYTSGSTGTPKGVSVTQINICSNLDVLSRLYPIRPGKTRLLQACSQAFDVSVFEILFALTRGLTLCAATNDVLFADIERAIRAMGVTHLSMTPTVAALINPSNVPQVEFLVTSGEPMTADVAKKWMGKLYQGYGPSETTNICSVKKMTHEDHIRHLGHVFENTSALVLHPQTLTPVPIGCVGELCFGGEQVVAGYLHLPEVAAEKFIIHPHFGRIYRSGDIGRMLADGSLLIVGRVDDQVKLRGQRVELGEVTSAVVASSSVASAVTMLLAAKLVAFYIPRGLEGRKFQVLAKRNDDEIFSVLRGRLPGYMVPSYLIPISLIPMTSSGKIDKAKLRQTFDSFPSRDLEGFGSSDQVEDEGGEWDEEEQIVARVVAEVLGSRDIGRWTPLTSLGLDSISAIALAKGLQRVFEKRVAISAILQNTCVAKLAVLFTKGRTEEVVVDNSQFDVFSQDLIDQIERQVSEKGHHVEAILPCTPLQEAMLASSANDASYLNKMLFRLSVEAEAMKGYWTAMFQRHGILRTCFFSTNDREHAMAQCVLKEWQPGWKTDGSVPAPLDSCVPPVSLAIIEDAGDVYLSFVCHHAMYDGVAITILLKEIEMVAAGVKLPPAPTYEPFLKEMLGLPNTTDTFWQEHLGNSKPEPLPRTETTESGRHTFTRTLCSPLTHLKTLNTSLLALLQAAWSITLHTLHQTPHVTFGNVLTGRTLPLPGLNQLVAPCFNTIPTHIDFHEHRRNTDVLRFFQALNPELLRYQFTPLRRIGGKSLFESLLLVQQPARQLDKKVWELVSEEGEMDVPLVCEVTPGEELEVKIHFERSRISDAFAEIIYDIFQHVLSTFLQYPSSHVLSRSTLPPRLQEGLDALNLIHASTSNETTMTKIDDRAWSDTEKTIRSVLARISNVSENKITRHTTIFRLGLDSINAVQVAAMLRKESGLARITAMDVLENPTCAKIAAKMGTEPAIVDDQLQYDLAAFQARVRTPAWDAVGTVLPCTPLQMGLLTDFMNSNGRDYFNFLAFRVDAGTSASALRESWVTVVKVHSILRTGFAPVDDADTSFAMLQYELKEQEVPVDTADILDVESWREEVAAQVLGDLRQPPWRVMIAGEDMHLAIHHVLYDAHSLQTILNDLSQALHGRQPLSKPEPTAAVQDILTQTQQSRKTAKQFWESQAPKTVINKFPVMTPLREDKRSILVKSTTSILPFSALEAAVKTSGVTVQAAAQAAWLRILSSYLGESSVVFGTILSGRNSEATRDAVFPCIVTLPIVGHHLSSNRELLEAMMGYNVELQRHQRAPLAEVQRWLGSVNTRLFDTLVVYQRSDNDNSVWTITDEKATVEYPVSLEIEPHGEKVEFRVTFFDDILPAEQAELLLRQFDAVFCDLVQHPDGNEDDLLDTYPKLFSILPAEEPDLKTQVSYLHEFVEVSAQRYPDKTALSFVSGFQNNETISREWSYKELDEQGNRVANLLSAHVQTGDIVAVLFDKCPEAHFAMLGILKAGCALLALDPGAPASRKEFILQDSGASVLLTGKEQVDFDVTVPLIAVYEDLLASTSSTPVQLSRPLTPNDRSYCLYTSGTTGTPKGCEITHSNAVQALLAFQQLFTDHWTPDSKWLQFASYHFDVSILEQYWTWSVGITLVAAPRDLILTDLAYTISRLAITHIDLTPSLARLLHPSEVPSLCRGVFITGGESLKQEILDVWGPERVIHNFYGPTETTIGVTTYPRVPINGRASNIGRQFLNVGTFVLRAGTDRPVLKGGVGELCVSGKLVGKGYLNRPELTAERFPALEKFGERVYRTGDLVRVLHDGCFDFLGRADDQVKLRGQRLEIGEINHCIRTGVDEVSDVVTLVVRNEKMQKELLVSFVVKEQQRKQELRVLKEDGLVEKVLRACRAKLPGYMVPTYVLLLPYIPLSPNNKAEVKELRALFNKLSPEELMTPSSSSSAELGRVGQQIRKAITSMLGEENIITPASNIFELGVDSISVLRLARALKREGLKSATPALVLRHPLVGDLAHALSQKDHTSSSSILEAKQTVEACAHRHRGAALGLGEVEYIAPCSALQQGMISRSRSEGAYFNVFRYELANGVDVSKLRAAWEGLVRAHSVLRTRFVETTEGYVQVAVQNCDIAWEELESCDPEERWRAWIERNDSVINQPLEFLLVANKILVVHIFHAIYDANSYDLMLEEVAARYNGKELPTAPSFLDALLRGPLKNHASSKSFWVEHLNGMQPTPLPQLSQTPSAFDISATRQISFANLDKVRRKLGVTQQSLLQALWASVLQSYAGSVTLGIIVSGRYLEDAETVVGPLFNTLPYHHHRQKTWAESIRQCQAFHSAIAPFQHVPLRDVQKWCYGGRAVFDTLFSFSLAGEKNREHPWREVEGEVRADYPLAFEATLLPGGTLKLLIVAQKGVADDSVLGEMLDRFQEAANAVIEDPDSWVLWEFDVSFMAKKTSEPTQDVEAASSFEWTPEAQIIRKEMALLADLDEDSISPTTSLLELGLDSIDTIKLSARLRRAGVVLSNSELIKGQTIANFRVHDSGYSSDTTVEDSSAGALREHLGVEEALPPTSLQDAMVSEMLQSDFGVYFNHDVLEIAEDVDVERLKEAWRMVMQHSPILRTAFVEVESPLFDFAYAQVVSKQYELDFPAVTIDSLDEMSSVLEQARNKAREGQGRENLLQVTFVQANGKSYLVLSIAHALYDGWSLRLLHQDIEAAYHGTYSPRKPYDTYLQSILHSQGDGAREFWANYIDTATPTLFPAHKTTLSTTIHRAERRLPSAALKLFTKHHAISTQAIAQASLSAVLAAHCRRLDIVFGCVLSGRESEAAEELLFPTMNTVPVRAVLHGSGVEMLRYLQENLSEVRSFQQFPLRKIQAGRGPLFNTLFILQKSSSDNEIPAKLVTSVDGGESAVEYPVCVELEVVGEEVVWRVACDDAYLSAQGTQDLLDSLQGAMRFFLDSPDENVLDFSNEGVSVCGLATFQLESQQPQYSEQDTIAEDEAWSSTEETIRQVLAQMSGLEAASITKKHNLYHLGLDSISAIKVSSALRKQRIRISVREMTQASSIKEMACKVLQPETTTTDTQSPDDVLANSLQDIPLSELFKDAGISPEDVEATLPATAMQTHMLTVSQNTHGAVFHPTFTYRLSSSNHTHDSIMTAWNTLTRNHPLLRTHFLATGSSGVPFVQAVLREQVKTNPFVSLDIDQQGLLVLRIHHALYDGVSLPALMSRFCDVLQGKVLETDDGFASWKAYIASHHSEEAITARKAFWTGYLSGVHPSPPSTSRDTTRINHLHRAALHDTAHLRALSACHGVSIQALFLAAYATTLRLPDVVFGVYLANRGTEGQLETYPTLSIVPLRVRVLDGDLVGTAKAVQGDLARIEKGVGLWEIAEWTGCLVEGFVNFLSLPGEPEDGSDGKGAVRIEEVRPEEAAGMVNAEDVPWLEKNTVHDAYPVSLPLFHAVCVWQILTAWQDAVDIEASLQRNGALDIGVFGSRDRLGDDGAEDLIQKLVGVLSA